LAGLQGHGHQVSHFDPGLDGLASLPAKIQGQDFAFINLHGAPGEDGLFQAALDRLGCPYQGSGPTGSLLALDKAMAKTLYARAGLMTPDWELVTQAPKGDFSSQLRYPVFAKPNNGGSSLGIKLLNSLAELQTQLTKGALSSGAMLLEEAVTGKEVTCAVVGQEALPPILIQPIKEAPFFDYHNKYTPNTAQEVCPAPLSKETTEAVQAAALTAHRDLGLSGYSRTDFILTPKGPYILETNTLPGMTPTSLLPQAAAARGQGFVELLEQLIDLGLKRYQALIRD
jgi:D-alanine-D-alanine ligase